MIISWRGAKFGKLAAVGLEVVSDRTSATTRDTAARSRGAVVPPLLPSDPDGARRESSVVAFG